VLQLETIALEGKRPRLVFAKDLGAVPFQGDEVPGAFQLTEDLGSDPRSDRPDDLLGPTDKFGVIAGGCCLAQSGEREFTDGHEFPWSPPPAAQTARVPAAG
jgi:hypothetical protein